MGIDSVSSSYGSVASLTAGVLNQQAQARARQLDARSETQQQTQTTQAQQTAQTQSAQQTQESQLAQRAATVNQTESATSARLESENRGPTINANGQLVGTRIHTVA